MGARQTELSSNQREEHPHRPDGHLVIASPKRKEATCALGVGLKQDSCTIKCREYIGENSADGIRHEPYLTKSPVTHPMKIDSTVIDNLLQTRVAGVSTEEKEQT